MRVWRVEFEKIHKKEDTMSLWDGPSPPGPQCTNLKIEEEMVDIQYEEMHFPSYMIKAKRLSMELQKDFDNVIREKNKKAIQRKRNLRMIRECCGIT